MYIYSFKLTYWSIVYNIDNMGPMKLSYLKVIKYHSHFDETRDNYLPYLTYRIYPKLLLTKVTVRLTAKGDL